MNEHFYIHNIIIKEYFIKSYHKNQYLCRLIQIKSITIKWKHIYRFQKYVFKYISVKKINVIIKTRIKLCTWKNDHDGKR